jgi:hypothetical protein
MGAGEKGRGLTASARGLVAAGLIVACGGGLLGCGVDAGAPSDSGSAAGSPLDETLPSDGGHWQINIRSDPPVPRKGTLDVTYLVTDAAGAPVDGLVLQVLPWMPAHGHGTSASVAVTPLGNGAYLASPVYLYMAGHWELQTEIAGDVSDSVVPTIDIP